MNEYLETKSTVARTLIRVVDTRYSVFHRGYFWKCSLWGRELHYRGMVLLLKSEFCFFFNCICEETSRGGIWHRTSTNEKSSTGSRG